MVTDAGISLDRKVGTSNHDLTETIDGRTWHLGRFSPKVDAGIPQMKPEWRGTVIACSCRHTGWSIGTIPFVVAPQPFEHDEQRPCPWPASGSWGRLCRPAVAVPPE